MNRNHRALILETAKDGSVEGLVDLSAFSSMAKFDKLVGRTCADLKRRGLVGEIRTNRPKRSHAARNSTSGAAGTSGAHGAA